MAAIDDQPVTLKHLRDTYAPEIARAARSHVASTVQPIRDQLAAYGKALALLQSQLDALLQQLRNMRRNRLEAPGGHIVRESRSLTFD